MDGQQYEHECARILKKKGFTRIQVTKASNDQGIDIIAHAFGKKYGIQCKYYSSPVGNSSVQEAYSGARFYNCDIAAVLTNTTFTASAIELAKKTGVILWPNNHINVKYPLYLRLVKLMGYFMFIIGCLTVWAALCFEDIKFRPVQLLESICILGGGVFNIMQSKTYSLGYLSTACYFVACLISVFIGILLQTHSLTDFCIFLFAILASYISMKKSIKDDM